MAKKNKNTLADMSIEQLHDNLTDTKLQLKKLKFTHSIQPLENPMEIRNTKREVARLLTEISKRENQEG